MKGFQFVIIFFVSFCFISIKSKEPSPMITIPLKLVNTTFEKYPFSTNQKQIIEEVPIKTIFGTKMVKQYKAELKDISGNITKESSSLFVAPIMIGGQNFNVVLDTGSINLWVPKIGSKDIVNITNHYDPKKSTASSSTSETFEIQYGTGSTKGNYYSDYVSFISGAAYNLLFGAATETVFNVTGADGIMGLAKDYKQYMYSAIWTLSAKKYIPNKSFSFKYLEKDDVQMYIGGEHPDFNDTENTASCQLLKKSVYDNLLWTCKLYSFGLIRSDLKQNITAKCGYDCLFDTGSNVMRLPKETLNLLNSQLSKFDCSIEKEKDTQYITCPINSIPDIFIEVGDHYFIIKGNEILSSADDPNKKRLRIQFMELQISLIGQPFFRYFHTKFDYENNLLKFHTKNKSSMIYSSAKPSNDEARHFDPDNILVNWLNEDTIKIIAAVSICVAVLFVVIVIVRCGKKNCCKKEKEKNVVDDL